MGFGVRGEFSEPLNCRSARQGELANGCRRRGQEIGLPITDYPLPIAHYQLPIAIEIQNSF